jgi:hypothetical protein
VASIHQRVELDGIAVENESATFNLLGITETGSTHDHIA